MYKNSKGFSLVEVMIVIAIIAILVAVAIPIYANYIIKTKIGNELERLEALKTSASEYISHNAGSLEYTAIDLGGDLPSGASIGADGSLNLDTSSIVADSSISLVPMVGSGFISWGCSTTGLTSSQIPSGCSETSTTVSYSFDSSLVQSGASAISRWLAGNCKNGTDCYLYGDDTMFRENTDWFQLYNGPNIATGNSTLTSQFAEGVNPNPNSFRYFVKDDNGSYAEITIGSQADIDNLTSEQADEVNTAMNLLKGGKYCSSTNNKDKFACSL